MATFYKYDPVKLHFTGYIEAESQPENATSTPVPTCDGDRFAKWELNEWVVKHLVDGVWVNCTDEIPLSRSMLPGEEIIPPVDGEISEEDLTREQAKILLS